MTHNTMVEISPSDINDVESFEELRLSIYEDYAPETDERITALRDLALATTLDSGERLGDAALRTLLEDIETPQAESRSKAFKYLSSQAKETKEEKAKEKEEEDSVKKQELPTTTYKLTYDKKGILSGLAKVTHLPEDKANTAAGHRLVIKVPSGPKKNDSSFRTNIKAV